MILLASRTVEQGAGHDAVLVEDRRPFFEGAVGGEDDGAVFVALADDLK